ncbi:MAG: pimeloyl-ACP methyl ester carboxylesterase [Ascidiaceihabitans sp.]|jgi:pimeloyl-ACP methyl ester carboxylesterase
MLLLENRFNYNGTQIAWGKIGSGPALVLLHGTPFSSQVWRRIAPLLAARFTVYFFDLIGYGQSEKHEGQDVSLTVQNGLMSALFDHWELDRPEVLAHDFGGATAMRAWHIDGLRYARLTIFDAVVVRPWGSPFVTHVRNHEAAFARMPAYMHAALLRAYLQTAAHKTLSEDAFEVYMTPWLGPIGQPAFYRQIAQMDQSQTDEIQDSYGPMDCDVRVLWGEKDDWIPFARGQEFADLIAGGKITRIPSAGHLVQEDAPEAIVAAMLDRRG